MRKPKVFSDSPLSRILFDSTTFSWVWFALRVYVGYLWLSAGWAKVGSSAWTGDTAGAAITKFVDGALAKTGGAHPDVQGWYAWFLKNVVSAHPELWAHFIVWGEVAVGVALIIGALTGIAAFFGLFMNLNYLLAGTISINPILFTASIGLILAWKVAGYYGLDYYLLPLLGTPWAPGELFNIRKK